MPLETATYINQLVATNPPDTDPEGQGAAHLRLIKTVLTTTFPTTTAEALVALQPTGTGPVIVPNVANVAQVTFTGASGQASVTEQLTAANMWIVSVTDTTGANPVQALAVDNTGTIYVGPQATPVSFVGEIRLWSGATTNIPKGWALCNGANGTPNLMDRMVIGAGNLYAVGNTGGAAATTLALANIPAHAHGVNDPGHNHTLNDPGHAHGVSDPGHSHSMPGDTWIVSTAGTGAQGQQAFLSEGNFTNPAYTSIGIQGATTGAYNSGAATGITIQSVGSGAAATTISPYYALAYIMRTA